MKLKYIFQTIRGILYWPIVAIGLVALLVSGCSNQSVNKDIVTTFEQLYSNPSQYSGEIISLEGFAFFGFEIIVVSEELRYSGYAEGHLIPSGRILWIEGGIPTNI